MTPNAAMLKKTRCVVAVRDLDVSVRFYRDMLGMELEFEVPGWAFLARGNFSVMLTERRETPRLGQLGEYTYFAYVTVEAIDQLYAEYSGRKLEVVKPLVNEPWGMREFGVKTVDGHSVMFGQETDSAHGAA